MPEYRVNDDLVLITKAGTSITRGQFAELRKAAAIDAYSAGRDRRVMPPGGQLVRKRKPVRKKADDPKVVVYDAHGRAVGLADPDDIKPVAGATPGGGAPPPTAPQAVDMTTGQPLPGPNDPVANAGAELAKSLHGARLAPTSATTLRKSAADTDRAFDALVRELDRFTADRLKNDVAIQGLALASSLRVPAAGGVAIAKSLALDAAASLRRSQPATPGPVASQEAALELLNSIYRRPPTVDH